MPRALDESSVLLGALVQLARHLETEAKAHLKQVVAQQPEFDIHDRDHCANVERNICALLGEAGIAARTPIELFLLHASAHLHDCAMALPQWEINLLEFVDRRTFERKLPAICTAAEAIKTIRAETVVIFGGQPLPREWLFLPEEPALQAELGERLRSYQTFRNGYSAGLESLLAEPEAYSTRTSEIRRDFIRQTHCTRIEEWIRNLDRLFADRLGGSWAKGLANDLASVCRSHGEGADFVRQMGIDVGYWRGERANIQLVALLLRLGDVCDFSAERAPSVLLQQKLIGSPVSRDHWQVKNEGISYAIAANTDGTRVVRFSAFFRQPRLFYMFHGYLDNVDAELLLYTQVFYSGGERSEWRSLARLSEKVDRSDVRYDRHFFEPVPDMRFTLDQKRILELLMGVKLYKDPAACIRELYQNAVDAVQCRLAAEGARVPGVVEFGLGEDENGKFLYCQDNGVGMTRDTVARYLLKVGNSYYRSQDFQRLSSAWKSQFSPVSQFGIGILSCFMLGDRLEVITKPLPSIYDSLESIRFVIEGPHEHFYFTPIRPQDREQIEGSGTIIKLYLKTAAAKQWHTGRIDHLLFWVHAEHTLRLYDPLKDELARWESHLLRVVSGFVGEYPKEVAVQIRCEDGAVAQIPHATTIFDYRKLDIPRDLMEVWNEEQKHLNRHPQKYFEVLEQARIVRVDVEYCDVHFATAIALPKKNCALENPRDLSSVGFLHNGRGLLLNGIRVDHNQSRIDSVDSLVGSGILDFRGADRPQLSIDRVSIVEWPERVIEIAAELHSTLADAIVAEVCTHVKRENLEGNSPELRLLWDHLFWRFSYLAGKLITRVVATPEANFLHEELSNICGRPVTLADVTSNPEITVVWPRYAAISEVSQRVLIGKLHSADQIIVQDRNIHIRGSKFAGLVEDDSRFEIALWHYVVRADEWNGEYAKYDLVGSLWPVIPDRLFSRLGREHAKTVNERTVQLHHFGNGLTAIPGLDPLLIHPRQGVYRIKQEFHAEKPISRVYRFDEIANNFWLFEVHRSDPDRSKRWVVTAFINPRPLTEREKTDLDKLGDSDPEYVRGATEGWSLLLLGQRDVNIICKPGLATRAELVAAIPKAFWQANAGKSFRFLDGEPMLAPADRGSDS